MFWKWWKWWIYKNRSKKPKCYKFNIRNLKIDGNWRVIKCKDLIIKYYIEMNWNIFRKNIF